MNQDILNDVNATFNKLKESTFNIITVQDLYNDPNLETPKYLVNDLIPRGKAILLTGREGSFKSFISQNLAKSIADGDLFLGRFACSQGTVLIIDKENSKEEVRKRYEMMGLKNTHNLIYADWRDLDNIYFDGNEKTSLPLVDFIIDQKVDLLILDSYIRFSRNIDENSSNDLRKINDRLARITRSGTSVLILDHHNKTELNKHSSRISNLKNVVRGTTEKLAYVDLHFTCYIEELQNDLIRIDNPKNRLQENLTPFYIKFIKEPLVTFEYQSEISDTGITNKRQRTKSIIIELLHTGPANRQTILNQVANGKGLGQSETDKLLKEMILEKLIMKDEDFRASGQPLVYKLVKQSN